MSDSNDVIKTEENESKENLVDINDQNILDYDDEIENNNVNTNTKEKTIKQEVDDDSDGEIKSVNQSDNDLDDGEVPSPRYDRNANASASVLKEDLAIKQEKQPEKQEIEEKDEEEDGEINDGEKAKKVFVPRVLCKYYQRGKCTWGRGCKFLHPGVNDTGNYNFLEFQDPNAAVFQQSAKNHADASDSSARPVAAAVETTPTESAWERGLRHAKEMKEKALRRKQIEGEQFADKKMNLSLKEFETEKENDERYVNVERMATADDDLEDEDLNQFKSWRLNQEKSAQPHPDDKVSNRNDDKHYNQRASRPKRGSISPERDNKYNRQKSDDWHDPWDRSKNRKKQTSRDYNSSDSDSRSRSRSDSRSSYSSRSSSSYRSSSYSSRSNSRSPNRYSKSKKTERPSRPRADVAKKPAQTEKTDLAKSLKAKPLPGRQISDFSLKKAGLDADKSAKKNRKNRSNSRSSTSSNDSYKSNDDNDSDEDYSKDESGSDDDSDDEFSKKKKNKIKPAKKRTAQDAKGTSDAKKQKLSEKPGQNIDKKQAIKDQLKLLESALKKKTSAK